MRKFALAGLFAVAFVIANTPKTGALTPEALLTNDLDSFSVAKPTELSLNPEVVQPSPAPEQPAQPAPPPPVTHVVAKNETLTSIAAQHSTTWKRIYNKNAEVKQPDLLVVGQQLTIPTAEETLAEREVAAPVVQQPVAQPVAKRAAAVSTPSRQSRGSVAGNTYTAGYCTWYVKNRRPDLPNNLGNAYAWVSNAAAQGMATGSAPRAGAVGQRGYHVVYVESVNGDGTVNISEMNHTGLYQITHRTLPANYFTYIY